MTKSFPVAAELILPLDYAMAPVASRFAEETGRVWGMEKGQQVKIAMAVEELFLFLASDAREGESAKLICHHGGYYMQVTGVFPVRSLPVALFNITAKVHQDDEESLSQLGLLLAARAVDRLEMVKTAVSLELRLIIEREYPPGTGDDRPLPPGAYKIKDGAAAQDWKHLAQRIYGRYGEKAPGFTQFPGKLVDMIASNDYDAVVAADSQGNIAGGVIWKKVGKMAEMYGPYVFCDQPGLIAELLDASLAKMGRSQAVCVVNRTPLEMMPPGYFENLGPDLYRQLAEDQGALSYVHPGLNDFVAAAYQRLVLPRHIQTVQLAGEKLPLHSALSANVDWRLGQATVSILAAGANLTENLTNHVAFLKAHGVGQILFRLDLGLYNDALLGQEIMAAGFEPQILLPWGGTGDVVLFVHQEDE